MGKHRTASASAFRPVVAVLAQAGGDQALLNAMRGRFWNERQDGKGEVLFAALRPIGLQPRVVVPTFPKKRPVSHGALAQIPGVSYVPASGFDVDYGVDTWDGRDHFVTPFTGRAFSIRDRSHSTPLASILSQWEFLSRNERRWVRRSSAGIGGRPAFRLVGLIMGSA